MATNPMQKKARLYAFLGAFITLIITGVIIAFLAMQLVNMKKEQSERVQVYVLKQDVKSGQVITSEMLTKKSVDINMVPANSATDLKVFMPALTLRDKAGNSVGVDQEGKLYIQRNGTKKELLQESKNGVTKYYIMNNNEKEYIEFDNDPIIAKTDLPANTVLSKDLITNQGIVTKDLRLTEYNMIVLPTNLEANDYIDIRLQLPNGQNFVVISKKRVIDANEETVWMNLNEYEILTMSSAIVETYMMKGSKLYAIKYTDAGIQDEAIGTYYPNNETTELINSDPNIVQKATEGLNANIRAGSYQNMINQYQEQGLQNIEAGISEEITKSIKARQDYVDGL